MLKQNKNFPLKFLALKVVHSFTKDEKMKEMVVKTEGTLQHFLSFLNHKETTREAILLSLDSLKTHFLSSQQVDKIQLDSILSSLLPLLSSQQTQLDLLSSEEFQLSLLTLFSLLSENDSLKDSLRKSSLISSISPFLNSKSEEIVLKLVTCLFNLLDSTCYQQFVKNDNIDQLRQILSSFQKVSIQEKATRILVSMIRETPKLEWMREVVLTKEVASTLRTSLLSPSIQVSDEAAVGLCYLFQKDKPQSLKKEVSSVIPIIFRKLNNSNTEMQLVIRIFSIFTEVEKLGGTRQYFFQILPQMLRWSLVIADNVRAPLMKILITLCSDENSKKSLNLPLISRAMEKLTTLTTNQAICNAANKIISFCKS